MQRCDGPAMTLGDMRALGPRRLDVFCGCGRDASVLVDAWSDDLEIPPLLMRFRCAGCGKRPSMVRPDWTEHNPSGKPRPRAR